MNTYFEPDEGTQLDEKRCAICGTIDKRANMEFKKVKDSPITVIEGQEYQTAIWVCKQCA